MRVILGMIHRGHRVHDHQRRYLQDPLKLLHRMKWKSVVGVLVSEKRTRQEVFLHGGENDVGSAESGDDVNVFRDGSVLIHGVKVMATVEE